MFLAVVGRQSLTHTCRVFFFCFFPDRLPHLLDGGLKPQCERALDCLLVSELPAPGADLSHSTSPRANNRHLKQKEAG